MVRQNWSTQDKQQTSRVNVRRRNARGSKPRRGVLLLIVLSLLVLFMLVGLSFMVSASQFSTLSKSAAKADEQGMPGAKLADSVMYQLVRGTTNPTSAIRGHSLLEDMYGRDYLIGNSRNANDGSAINRATDFAGSNHQIHSISFNTTPAARLSAATEAQLRDDYYAGCVLTFLNGPAAGQSTRILEYKPLTMGRMLVKGVPVRSPNGTSIRPPYVPNDASGQPVALQFIINGRPFSGTGAGYNPATGAMDNGVAAGLNLPAAFMPNTTFRDFFNLSIPYNVGGLDESWDAVDYQNMALAKSPSLSVLAQAEAASAASVATTPAQVSFLEYLRNTGGATPSFHRPYLVAHLALQEPLKSQADPIMMAMRAGSLRINPTDHPTFSGSNPDFNPLAGPWDVDNTGSGVADSVWIDAGLAPVAGPDGRLYKPLAAIHCVDMDGRIPINAADSLEHRKTIEAVNTFRTNSSLYPNQMNVNIGILDKNSWGSGHGPADISTRNAGSNLLRNRYAGLKRQTNSDLAERYVGGIVSPTTPPWEELSTPGIGPVTGTDPSGLPLVTSDDDLNQGVINTHLLQATPRVPNIFRTENSVGFPGAPGTGYGSPTDLQVRSLPYLDPQGNIVWAGRNLGNYDGLDDPYEINLLDDTSDDSPYDLADLDAINRFDSQFFDESRAVNALNTGGVLENLSEFTTHSFSVPSLPAISPGRFRVIEGQINRDGNAVTNSLRDMFAAKITRTSPSLSYRVAHRIAGKLMAPEFIRGEKLDINKVLVPNEGLSAAQYTAEPATAMARQATLLQRKEIFARHLFNLMMLLSEDDLVLPNVDNKTTPPTVPAQNLGGRTVAKELQIRRLAQWAINVVDFGDADSVMTQFRYDANPFNELDPFDPQTGLVRTATTPEEQQAIQQELRVVWGMEHPELLLTETLAFHDRRAEDSSSDPSGKNLPDDPHLDSIDEPEGSAFFELYCPRSPQTRNAGGLGQATARGPEDLWSSPTTFAQQQLQLSKMIGPNPATPGLPAKPVWRLAISEITEESENNDPLYALQNNPDTSKFEPLTRDEPEQEVDPLKASDPLRTVDPLNELSLRRFVWFTRPATPLPTTGDEETTDNTYVSSLPSYFVNGGSYVLVGPNDGRLGTPVGRQQHDGPESTQRIALDGSRHRRVDDTRLRPLGARVVSVPATTIGGDRLSVSEPIGGYDTTALPSDIPLDNFEPSDPDNAEEGPLFEDPSAPEGVLATGMKENFRSVFLQRLANPNLPWHPETNPYRTIDWMPIDLHVFNSQHGRSGDLTEDDNSEAELERWNFASREKTGFRDLDKYPFRAARAITEIGALNIWSAWTNLCPRAVDATGTELDRGYGDGDPAATAQYTDGCNTNVAHSLGWLNRSFDIHGYGGVDGVDHFNTSGTEYTEAPLPVADPTYTAATFQYPTITDASARQTWIDNARANFRTTFPTLVWHNRPYANPHEMLLVPATSNARLGVEYTVSQPASPYLGPDERVEHRGAFGHLLNFFHSSLGIVGEQPNQLAGNYFRIFDFVHVPSRFKGTRTYLNQTALGATNPYRKDPSNYIDLMTTEKPELLANGELAWRPTSISEFREPGKVNINTAPWRVWLELGFDSALKSNNNDRHAAFELSMAGYNYPRLELDGTDASDGINNLSGRYPNGWHPAEYPNPLRAGTTADLMPRLAGASTVSVNPAIDGTMLRSILFRTDGRLAPANAQVPRQTGLQQPALGAYSLSADQRQNNQVEAFAMQNRKTNAYFRYKDLMKLGNSITSQSNVYAVWVTIGYFEIEPNIGPNGELYQVDRQHPDGYRYGVELGSDLGQVTRNRSFYIVDRSIPVAFEPGVNHNVDNAILVRRHLE